MIHNKKSDGDDHPNTVRMLCGGSIRMLLLCINVFEREHKHSIHTSPAESKSHCADDFQSKHTYTSAKDCANNVICI